MVPPSLVSQCHCLQLRPAPLQLCSYGIPSSSHRREGGDGKPGQSQSTQRASPPAPSPQSQERSRRRWASGRGGGRGQVQEGSGLAHGHEQQASGRAGPRTPAPLLLAVCLSLIQNCGKAGGDSSAFFSATLEQPPVSSPVASLPTQELCGPEHSQWNQELDSEVDRNP